MRSYLLRCAVAFDVLCNTVMNGDDDMTVSLRAERAKVAGKLWGRVLCRILNWFEPGHCADQENTEEGREQPE